MASQSQQVKAQIVPNLTVGLESSLSEASGISVRNDTLWIANDGGSPSEIYLYHLSGNYLGKINLSDIPNKDWEALEWQGDSVLWIADFGNNSNNRRDLKFYKLSKFQFANGQWSYHKDSLAFEYQNQTHFPPAARDLHFDCEAFIVKEDSIFLFSKNRSEPYNGLTYMHYLEAKEGTQVTVLVDSFNTGNGPKETNWVTDASYSNNTLWLLSHGYCLRFDSFEENRFELKNYYTFSNFSQKEGIAYHAPNIYVVDESKRFFEGQKLYRYLMDSASVLDQIELNVNMELNNCKLVVHSARPFILQIVDMSGKIIIEKKGSSSSIVSLKELPINFIVLLRKNNYVFRKKIYNPCLR